MYTQGLYLNITKIFEYMISVHVQNNLVETSIESFCNHKRHVSLMLCQLFIILNFGSSLTEF